MTDKSDFPKVGIALGSGAARGWAHIGIIKALEQIGIRPAIVAGTSIGALVGAAYASNRLDKLEQWVRPMTWADTISYLDISVMKGGLIQGDKLLEAIQRETFNDIMIETMPKAFGAIATQLRNGHEVWLQRGSLLKAVRASIALPGLFTPVKHNGVWMVDGALVNPVPVSLCRAMGAEIVIAVNLNSNVSTRFDNRLEDNGSKDSESMQSKEAAETEVNIWDRVGNQLMTGINDGKEILLSKLTRGDPDAPGVYEVFARTINIMQDRITRSRMAGDPPEVVICPDVLSIGTMDFHKAGYAISQGEASVFKLREELEVLKKHL